MAETFGQTLTTTIGSVATSLINTFADRSSEQQVVRRVSLEGTVGDVSTGLIFVLAAVVVVILIVRK